MAFVGAKLALLPKPRGPLVAGGRGAAVAERVPIEIWSCLGRRRLDADPQLLTISQGVAVAELQANGEIRVVSRSPDAGDSAT